MLFLLPSVIAIDALFMMLSSYHVAVGLIPCQIQGSEDPMKLTHRCVDSFVKIVEEIKRLADATTY
jgi:hypothetical protein